VLLICAAKVEALQQQAQVPQKVGQYCLDLLICAAKVESATTPSPSAPASRIILPGSAYLCGKGQERYNTQPKCPGESDNTAWICLFVRQR
jgi:hypothetical protein